MKQSWIGPFLAHLPEQGVSLREEAQARLAPARCVILEARDWARLAQAAKDRGVRYVAGWADDTGADLRVFCALEKDASYLVARTVVPHHSPGLPSQTPHYPGAVRSERHIRDLFGVRFTGHTDPRRWTRHQAWGEEDFPLRKNAPAAGRPVPVVPPDDSYPFVRAEGSGVYEIPVGPVHAGIIEPGHFRFQAVGETILNLEQHLGYVHKGIEKIAEGRDAPGLARLAARVSGDTTVAHTWAACMAMERAGSVDVPPRAAHLRAIMAERERVANHLGDIGAVCNDVAFTFAFYQFGRLREQWLRTSREAFGHRFMMDRVVPGGVAADVGDAAMAAMQRQNQWLRKELRFLSGILEDYPTLEDRLVTTGYLSPALARAFGALGYVGRASGVDFDLRRDAPYPPYDRLPVAAPAYPDGDVATRNRVRMDETLISLDLIDQLLARLPQGPLSAPWPAVSDREGLGLIEGWRGEILTYVRFDANGRIARYYPRDPSVMNWPALEKLVRDNIVPDFPVCNKSVNGSYSGNDL